MTKSLTNIASKINSIMVKTVQNRIEIGTLLNKHLEDIEKGDTEEFYIKAGIASRTAQRYKRVAGDPKVIELIESGKISEYTSFSQLEGLIKDSKAVNKPIEYEYDSEFNYKECRTVGQFKVQYEALLAELETYKVKVA